MKKLTILNGAQFESVEKEFWIKRDEMDEIFYNSFEPIEDFFKKKVGAFLFSFIKILGSRKESVSSGEKGCE